VTPRERRDWPWITGAIGFILGFCLMSLVNQYFGG